MAPAPADESRDIVSPQQAEEHRRAAEQRALLGAFESLERTLSIPEWNAAGTRKLVLDKLDHLVKENVELKPYRERFHGKDKEAAVIAEQLVQCRAAEVLYSTCLAFGGALFSFGFWLCSESSHAAGTIAIVLGIGLTLGAGVSRANWLWRLRRQD